MAFRQNTAPQCPPVIAGKAEQSRHNTDKIKLPRTVPILHNDENEKPDRHTLLLKWANELGQLGLLENKKNRQKQWTAEKRSRQSRIINKNKPWMKSTGAKSAAGKRISSQNALKHGLYSTELKKFKAALNQIEAMHRKIHAQTWETIRTLREIRAKNRAMTQSTLMAMTKEAHAFFKTQGMPVSFHEVKRMVKEATGLTEADFITAPDTIIPEKQAEKLQGILDRRVKGEPLTRIVGETEFWGLPFKVTPDVLDPRPDTETLVEAVLSVIGGEAKQSGHPDKNHGLPCPSDDPLAMTEKPLKILDLGTGTGCIPIALLSELPHAIAYAVEYSFEAAQIARENAQKNGVADRFHILQGDWMAALTPQFFDIITSNPPYIVESDIADLSPEVKNHDPILALSGGKNGMDCYKKIISYLKTHLKNEGRAFLEIGFGQLSTLKRLVDDSNLFLCDSMPDIAGIPRVVEIHARGRNGDK